jgi:hypothetical protein
MSQIDWLLAQSKNVLSQTEVNRRFLEADHTFLHKNNILGPDRPEAVWEHLHHVFHPEVIKNQLSQKLDSFSHDLVDELHASLADNWGTDVDEWREVRVYDTMLDVISRLSTRVFVGKELCRDKGFMKAASSFNQNVVISAAALNLLPGFLRP